MKCTIEQLEPPLNTGSEFYYVSGMDRIKEAVSFLDSLPVFRATSIVIHMAGAACLDTTQ